jgi:hypothetical protein
VYNLESKRLDAVVWKVAGVEGDDRSGVGSHRGGENVTVFGVASGASCRVDALGRGRRCRAPPRTSRWLSGCVWELRCSHRDRLHRRSRPCDRVRRAARSMTRR